MVFPSPGAGEGGGEGQERRGAQHGHVRGERHAAQAPGRIKNPGLDLHM